MSKAVSLFSLLLLAFTISNAQSKVATATIPRTPTRINDNSAEPQLGIKLHFKSMARLAPMGFAATSLKSIPHWNSSFTYKGSTYPYIMVGRGPSGNATTSVNTVFLPISFYFEEFVDSSGHHIVISPSSFMTKFATSPNFESASYGTGFTQFGDAVQRAEFWHHQSGSWHTLLNAPAVRSTVQVKVPKGMAQLFQTQSGTIFALMDEDFFNSVLQSVADHSALQTNQFAIALTANTFLYSNGNINACCVLGFHTAYQTSSTSTGVSVQTLAWASWISHGIFQNPGVLDVMALSHEISEWMNDPFASNNTPPWEFPDGSGCQNDLETGDPVEVLPHPTFPVTLHGFTYHPQTEALFQWFARVKPSTAFDRAYTYPDLTALTSPATACQ